MLLSMDRSKKANGIILLSMDRTMKTDGFILLSMDGSMNTKIYPLPPVRSVKKRE
jgi:hypothetical protein